MGAITPGSFNLDGPPLDSPLYHMDGVGDPAVSAGSSILVELTAYDFNAAATTQLRFGADGYNDPGAPGYFSPRMIQSLNFRRDMFSGNTTGGPTRVSYGELRLANDDGGLDTLRTQYAFAGWPATLYVGDINQPFSTFEILITGKPQQAFFSFRDVSITLRDRLQDFNQPVQTKKYLGDNILPDGLEGGIDFKDKVKPLLFGRVQNIEPPMVNTAKLVYQVNDGMVELISNVYDQGVALTRGPDYADTAAMMATQPDPGYFRCDMVGGYFRLGALPFGTVTCDAADRYTDTDTLRDKQNTAARVALRIASRPAESGEGGVTVADINLPDADMLDRANSSAVGIWVNDSATFGSCLDAVMSSVGAWYGFDRFGQFRMQRLQVPSGGGICTFKMFGPDVDAGWGDYDIIDVRFLPTNDPDRGVPTYEVKLNYGLNYTVQSKDNVGGAVSEERKTFLGLQYRTATATNTSLKTAYPLAIKKEMNSLLIEADAARTEVNRLLTVYQGQRDFIEIDTPLMSDLIATIDVGSEVLVILPRFNYYASPFADAELYYNFKSGFYGAITTTRASVGYALNSYGFYQGFSPDFPRITDLGLFVEEARTNRVRNNSMGGMFAGTPGTYPTNWGWSNLGTLTQTVIGQGIENGIDYIDIRWNGITSNTFFSVAFETITGIVATNGQTWTQSAFVKLIAGSFANISSIQLLQQELTSAGVFIKSNLGPLFTPTGASLSAQRQSYTVTLSGGVTVGINRPYIIFAYASGVAVDFTLRIGWPQLEFGEFVTSPIRTTGVALARNADVVTITTPPVFGSAYTVYGKGTPNDPTSAATQQLVHIDDGSFNNRVALMRTLTTGFVRIFMVSGGVTQFDHNVGGGMVWAVGTPGSVAMAVASGSQNDAFNGVRTDTDTTGTLPVGPLNTVRLGSNATSGGGQLWNGFIECVAIWPRRLSDPELVSLTQATTPTQRPSAGKSMLVTGMQYNPGTRGLTLSLWG